MDADLSCLVLTCSTPLAHTNGEGWWRRAEALVTITTIASGPTWDVDGRDGALVITQGGRWTAWAAAKETRLTQDLRRVCIVFGPISPLACDVGCGRLRQLLLQDAFAFTCLRACLPGRARQGR
jgi:hypothetical protein